MALYLWFYVVFITIKMVFSEKFPKNCVFEVFYCFCKNDHLISKTGLGPYFSLPNLLAAARCPSGNWNTFATEKITLQTNWE